MGQLMEFQSEQGGAILVEVADSARGPVMRGGRSGEAVLEAGESLEQVLGQLEPVLKGIVSRLRAAAQRPDEVVVEFAVSISADANVIIARAGGEANFRVALTWRREGPADG